MKLFFPTQMFEPGIQTSADPFPGSAGSVSNTSTFQWSPHTVISPPSAPATHRPASTASAAEVFCSPCLCFCTLVRWGAVPGRFSSGKTTQVKEIGTCASEDFFPLEHCSFAAAGPAGQNRDCAKKLSLLCCVLPFASCGHSCTVLVLIRICQE